MKKILDLHTSNKDVPSPTQRRHPSRTRRMAVVSVKLAERL